MSGCFFVKSLYFIYFALVAAILGCTSERIEQNKIISTIEQLLNQVQQYSPSTSSTRRSGRLPGIDQDSKVKKSPSPPSGETFDQTEMTATHPSLPLGTAAGVANLSNEKNWRPRSMIADPMLKIVSLMFLAAKKIRYG